MKAFQITGINEFGVKDIPQPTITENDVLVKMRASGICHSDYLLIKGECVLPFSYPVTPVRSSRSDLRSMASASATELPVNVHMDADSASCAFPEIR